MENELEVFQSQEITGRFIGNMNLRTGTDRLFTPDQLLTRSLDYFQYCIEHPIKSNQLLTGGQNAGQVIVVDKPRMFTIERLCIYLGVNVKYIIHLDEQIKDKTDVDSIRYSNTIEYIRNTIRTQRLELAAANELNALIVSRIEQLNERVDISGKIENTITSIVFQSRTIQDIQSEDVTDTAQTYLEEL